MNEYFEKLKDELKMATQAYVLASNRYDAAIMELTTKLVDGVVLDQIRTLKIESDKAREIYQDKINMIIEWNRSNYNKHSYIKLT
jgi:hypothetical protein